MLFLFQPFFFEPSCHLPLDELIHLLTRSNEHEDGFYNEFLVTQHDVLRELAICQTESEASLEKKRLNLEIREDTFPDWCLNPRHPNVNASLLSISTGNYSESLFSNT